MYNIPTNHFDLNPLFIRFVSFLLRLAHDRSRSAKGPAATSTSTQSPDAIVINQISKLAEQIRKGNEAMAGEGSSGGEGAVGGGPGIARAMRMVRAGQVSMMGGAQVPHSGANF